MSCYPNTSVTCLCLLCLLISSFLLCACWISHCSAHYDSKRLLGLCHTNGLCSLVYTGSPYHLGSLRALCDMLTMTKLSNDIFLRIYLHSRWHDCIRIKYFMKVIKNFLWKYGLGLVMCYLPWNEVVLKCVLVPLHHYSQGNMKFLPIPRKTRYILVKNDMRFTKHGTLLN